MDKSSPEYTSLYRATLYKLIGDIIAEIPTDVQHLVREFRNARETLAYTAPEILDNCVLTLLNILRLYVPWNDEESKNSQWIINIRRIWTDTIQRIDNGLDSEPEAEAPPQTAASEEVSKSEG